MNRERAVRRRGYGGRLGRAIAGLAAVFGVATSGGPVGSYRLATVDGVRAPMVWHAVDLHEGGQLQLSWTTGRVDVRRDGTFTLVVERRITGPALRGSPMVDSLSGTWRRIAWTRAELRLADGKRVSWDDLDGFRSLSIRLLRPDLDGERRAATLVFIRTGDA
jgi:hypothetical protein